MLVREAMTPWPYTVSAEQSLSDAIQVMAMKSIHQVPVVEGNSVVGIITDGDIRIALGPDSRTTPLDDLDGAAGTEVQILDWMTRTVRLAEPAMPLSEAAKAMADQRVGALPVVDEDGDVVGILSVTDVLWTAAKALEEYEGQA